ncbi:MAG: hypothetical protein CMJ28_04275 [Phycisphaerae bacterium]|nr:hypothetical protein [Phycisphaerae bacterium]
MDLRALPSSPPDKSKGKKELKKDHYRIVHDDANIIDASELWLEILHEMGSMGQWVNGVNIAPIDFLLGTYKSACRTCLAC